MKGADDMDPEAVELKVEQILGERGITTNLSHLICDDYSEK
jgi:hypothetical protein